MVEYNSSNSSIIFKVPLGGLQKDIDFVKSTFDKRNTEINAQNEQLKNTISTLLKERKDKAGNLEAEFSEAIQKVSIPLKRADISEKPIIDLQVRKNIQDLKKPLAQPSKEFILDRKYVLDILEIINLGGKQFELNPEVYGLKLGEEDLRNIILSYLNIIFEGSATGETFCKQGKTDIYLNIPKGQIFIAECKFWSGEQKYKETIDQLFRYLTWRRNYSLIITFAKSADFTQMMESAQQAINSHSTFSKGLEKLENTHFQSIHTFPEDSKKEIEIHHLFFNLYS
ncbi:MAG: hypothetical protein UT61_C0016G0013 [Candidatus Woesebacteria bacterium GW2011_GWA1_39_8]|uniref:Uncharacterized protein n=1 Tax=Candidatus Woesebacteria bacterium GW2011_GWA1_39_8 TaxID=1618552 RepID=A0A0G0SWJ3_9BACT|nr:MAG: hypothetical protein UT61_C0016G0013 [Candidatus Woesebacteria bacterium GW2011_GWA1_39_8]